MSKDYLEFYDIEIPEKFPEVNEKQFVQIFSKFNTNYIVMHPGFFEYHFLKLISIAYLDHKYDGKEYYGISKIKSKDIHIINYTEMTTGNDFLPFSIMIVNIKRKDLNKFIETIQPISNLEFNSRSLVYYNQVLFLYGLLQKVRIKRAPKEIRENLVNILKVIKQCKEDFKEIESSNGED